MQSQELTDDSKVILLLCGNFGDCSKKDAIRPLIVNEYNRIASWLGSRELHPGSLLEPEIFTSLQNDLPQFFEGNRLYGLLQRGAALAFAIEKWMNKGIWILTRSDERYPARLRNHLKNSSPPVLFGVGDDNLLAHSGMAIVGSRNIDSESERYTQEISQHCAAQGVMVISGGARGVDKIAMLAALEAGGAVVGVLADSLLRASVSSNFREAIVDARLLLLSPFSPEAGFSIGNAMGRNKIIYALSQFALIIQAELGKGGTWAGAVEELKRTVHIPLFIRNEGNIAEGNRELLKLGAIAFPKRPWNEKMFPLVANYNRSDSSNSKQTSLFNGF